MGNTYRIIQLHDAYIIQYYNNGWRNLGELSTDLEQLKSEVNDMVLRDKRAAAFNLPTIVVHQVSSDET